MMICIFVLVGIEFNNEILKHNNNSDFFLSGTMVQYFNGLIDLDCGKNPETFNEQRLLKELPKLKYDNFQGTTWAPSLLPLKTWKKSMVSVKNTHLAWGLILI